MTSRFSVHVTDRLRHKTSTCGFQLTVREGFSCFVLSPEGEEELRQRRNASFERALLDLFVLRGFGGICRNHDTAVMLQCWKGAEVRR